MCAADEYHIDREADIMGVLWRRGPSTVAEVRAELHDELAYTTVLTMLRTLQGKGYVGYEEEGRTYRYFAAVEQQDARKSIASLTASKQEDATIMAVLNQQDDAGRTYQRRYAGYYSYNS